MAEHCGPSNWWPADSPFEVALGAILTQNTAWRNVEKALASLRDATGLVPAEVAALAPEMLAEYVRPSGFFSQKSATIRAFLSLMQRHGGLSGDDAADGKLACFATVDDAAMREALLALRGIGPETADSILLYALFRPFFVVDAYTRRIFHRHGLVDDAMEYHDLQDFFMDGLEPDVGLFNEYHALIVTIGKHFCGKSKPKCAACPLRGFLPYEPT